MPKPKQQKDLSKLASERIKAVKAKAVELEHLLEHSHNQLLDYKSVASWLQASRKQPVWTDDNATILAARLCMYFEDCSSNGDRPTITGLTLACGFGAKSSMYRLSSNDRYPTVSRLIKRALLSIESMHEQGLHKPACTGHIFALKNSSEPWIDKTVKETSQNLPIVVVTGLPTASSVSSNDAPMIDAVTVGQNQYPQIADIEEDTEHAT